MAITKTRLEQGLFTLELEPKDLGQMRAATRRAHRRAQPREPRLTDAQCDTYINELGEAVVLEELRSMRKGEWR